MLIAEPKSMFSWDFYLLDGNREMAILDLKAINEAGEIIVDGDRGRFYREGLVTGDYVLEIEEGTLAVATKRSALTRTYLIESLGRKYTLKTTSVFSQNFILLEEGARIGSIKRNSWWSRKATISLPDDIPVLVQAFIFLMVVLSWRRQASSSG